MRLNLKVVRFWVRWGKKRVGIGIILLSFFGAWIWIEPDTIELSYCSELRQYNDTAGAHGNF